MWYTLTSAVGVRYMVSTDDKHATMLVRNHFFKDCVRKKTVPKNVVFYKIGNTPTVEIHTREPHKVSSLEKFWLFSQNKIGSIVYDDVIITVASDPTI